MSQAIGDVELFSFISENCQKPNLHKFMKLTEAEKIEVSRNLIDKIYVTIAERYNEIDFGSIPKSAGDITKMPEYKNLEESLKLLNTIAKDSKQNIKELATLSAALVHVRVLKDKFHAGFVKKNAGVILLYNTLTMAIYCGVSLMISVLVDYINVGNTDTVQAVIAKKYSKSNSYLMLDSLELFVSQIRSGAFETNLNQLMRSPNKSMQESVVLTTSVIVGAIIASFGIIPLIKEIIFLFYNSRLKLSEATRIQAELINANIESLKSSGSTPDKVIKIQKWFADKLEKLSHMFAFKYEKSEAKSRKEAKEKVTTVDIGFF